MFRPCKMIVVCILVWFILSLDVDMCVCFNHFCYSIFCTFCKFKCCSLGVCCCKTANTNKYKHHHQQRHHLHRRQSPTFIVFSTNSVHQFILLLDCWCAIICLWHVQRAILIFTFVQIVFVVCCNVECVLVSVPLRLSV